MQEPGAQQGPQAPGGEALQQGVSLVAAVSTCPGGPLELRGDVKPPVLGHL